ncbi:MAG: hypothetical protein KBB86_02730 [Candidatus Pacebacteria bacterium]|nr:hypothetical protein [Candidatus Paceibacterota bacterium]
MKASEAFNLARKIEFHYHRKLRHSTSINQDIAQALGPDLYRKFCEEVKNLRSSNTTPALKRDFSQKFIDSPVDEGDCMNDLYVYENYSFDNLTDALIGVTADH